MRAPLFGERYGQDVDHAPERVEEHWDQHAYEEQQERVIEELLQQRRAFIVIARLHVAHVISAHGLFICLLVLTAIAAAALT
jgi:hypothetical protein